MKRILAFFAVLLAVTFASTVAVNSVRADVTGSWLGSFYNWGIDSYHGKSVYGYEEDSTAMLLVTVENNLATSMNVSKIIVAFDWDINYTKTLNASVPLEAGETRLFTVTFTVPNTTIASNMFLHGYTIYVEHVNSTGGIVTPPMKKAYTSDRRFAVYSKDQAQAREMSRILLGLSTPTGGFNSTAAKLLWTKAANETNIAALLYQQGDFSGAKKHYSMALSYRDQAFTIEQALTGGMQDAQLALVQAQAKSFEATANYLNGLSNMWVLIGIAAVLFAIGYLIRGFGSLRKQSITAA